MRSILDDMSPLDPEEFHRKRLLTYEEGILSRVLRHFGEKKNPRELYDLRGAMRLSRLRLLWPSFPVRLAVSKPRGDDMSFVSLCKKFSKSVAGEAWYGFEEDPRDDEPLEWGNAPLGVVFPWAGVTNAVVHSAPMKGRYRFGVRIPSAADRPVLFVEPLQGLLEAISEDFSPT